MRNVNAPVSQVSSAAAAPPAKARTNAAAAQIADFAIGNLRIENFNAMVAQRGVEWDPGRSPRLFSDISYMATGGSSLFSALRRSLT